MQGDIYILEKGWEGDLKPLKKGKYNYINYNAYSYPREQGVLVSFLKKK